MIKCIVKDCENHKHEGGSAGDVCMPCYEFITTGKGIYSQAYRNTLLKDLTDEIYQLKEIIYYAIKAGDWKVDGACDPSELLDDFVPKGQDI